MLPPLRANPIASPAELASHYRQYLRVLNQRTFDLLHLFVARSVKHNGKQMNIASYSALIAPGTTFCPLSVVTDVSARTVAARLHVEVPTAEGIQKITEFVFYHFDEHWHIAQVHSSLEYGAVEKTRARRPSVD